VADLRFGAYFTPGVGTDFYLWAPDSRSVDVELISPAGDVERTALAPQGDGLFSLNASHASPGWRYWYFADRAGPFPDPASRRQTKTHGPSEVIDPSYPWTDQAWRGPVWPNAVIYELHVGAFTAQGTFDGVCSRLDYLRDLGVSAIELMPVAHFPGRRNWGYDGTFLFAPAASYGQATDLKRLIDECHARAIAVILDVVYNHLGPDGNYLWLLSRPFFRCDERTPWGESINIEHPMVAAFFRENVRHWIEDYHLDGLRFDAVHAFHSASRHAFLRDLQHAARMSAPQRQLFLVLENVDNESELLRETNEGAFDAQWSDDFHHALYVLLTGDCSGHYQDYTACEEALERAIGGGLALQGEYSHWRHRSIGSPTTGLTLDSFVYFLQNHDLVGNRAHGERLHQLLPRDRYRAAVAFCLFLPGIPMLFMGEEFAASTPFYFFTDHEEKLGKQVRRGRIRDHAAYRDWSEAASRDATPDPQVEGTFSASCLDWREQACDQAMLALYRRLFALRARYLPRVDRHQERVEVHRDERLITVQLHDQRGRKVIACVVNFCGRARLLPDCLAGWVVVFATKPLTATSAGALVLTDAAIWLRPTG
jgi:malto-oligosyltrehalose trehalohydrolase